MELLAREWKLVLIAALTALVCLLFWLWQGEVKEFAEFKGAVVVLGKEAEKFAKAENDKHEKALKEAKDEWNKMLPRIRSNAIDNYMQRFPVGLCGNDGGGAVRPSSPVSEGGDGAVGERVATTGSEAQDAFVAACAKDAGKLKVVRGWVIRNNLKVE